jgi:hypothetical protein
VADDDLVPDIDAWASAHGFAPCSTEISGATPLLRFGEVGTTDDAYEGEVDGHGAYLAEFSIGSPNITAEFAADGLQSEAFTLFLVNLDAARWPRLTVHPSRYPDHDIVKRVLHIDHRVHTVSPEMDDRYRVIAATAIPDRQLADLFTPDLVGWWLAQSPEISVDVEDHDGTGYLSVAHAGLGIGDAGLDQLLAQTAHLLGVLAPS